MICTNKHTVAIILGGGRGTRLKPLTSTRSKPAVPVAGKYRLVDIPISNCINSNINRIFVLTQFNSASLNRHIKNSYNFSLFYDSFVDILAAEQTPQSKTWFQGTADAVRKNMKHIINYDFDYCLILSGDQLYQMDFSILIEEHKRKKADITLATLPVTKKEAIDFRILKTDSNGWITDYIEKPESRILPEWTSEVGEEQNNSGKNYLASMGIYVFNREILLNILKNESIIDFGKEIIPQAIKNHQVFSFQHKGYWTDIGSINAFFKANLKFTEIIPDFNLFNKQSIIYTRARLLPPSKIINTKLKKTIISEGCIISASRIEHSLIGLRAIIGKDTVIENSIIMGSHYYQEQIKQEPTKGPCNFFGIGERCYINNAIIDKNCVVGDDVHINGGKHLDDCDNELYSVRDGIVIIPKGVCLPNGFTL